MYSQDYDLYTNEDHSVWKTLYERQLKLVLRHAHHSFLAGLKLLQFQKQTIPDFSNLNDVLKKLNGWNIYAVPGLIDNAYFFEKLQAKQFGVTKWIRKRSQLDYLEEPDLFHDVFGHVPQLADNSIGEYLEGLAGIAGMYITNEDAVEAIARLYWYTIEFGLIMESNDMEIYGAGILSSVAETTHAVSEKTLKLPFNVNIIIDTPYIKDSFQQQYFVVRSLSELAASLPEIEKQFKHRFGKTISKTPANHSWFIEKNRIV